MLKRFFKSKKGLTLVEVVVSLAILSILAVFILSIYASSFNTILGNANLKNSNQNAAAGIENKFAGFDPDSDIATVEQQTGNLEIDFGGQTIDAEGSIIEGTDKNNDSKYYSFIPD
ncbi:MAG: prepilin-type N-terminal cleavage/methylation domain-containing protein [Oscillospiraceae bacterium]|nr:prepilin-type N-terminal cleavage/methylation domain-containing protein [Oscillospiraceae bacterium]MDD4414244.1 prepilin-type N-terminal cleavage/methylation domain-containing protein [Oscillospiraceae bacterium]